MALTLVKSEKGGSTSRHKNIARSRGSKWRKNVIKGKIEARMNPSLICLARLQKRFYQSDMAKKLSVSESQYGAIERGRAGVSALEAQKISTILGFTAKKLFIAKGKKLFAILQKSALA